jgi:hypothetical protein
MNGQHSHGGVVCTHMDRVAHIHTYMPALHSLGGSFSLNWGTIGANSIGPAVGVPCGEQPREPIFARLASICVHVRVCVYIGMYVMCARASCLHTVKCVGARCVASMCGHVRACVRVCVCFVCTHACMYFYIHAHIQNTHTDTQPQPNITSWSA